VLIFAGVLWVRVALRVAVLVTVAVGLASPGFAAPRWALPFSFDGPDFLLLGVATAPSDVDLLVALVPLTGAYLAIAYLTRWPDPRVRIWGNVLLGGCLAVDVALITAWVMFAETSDTGLPLGVAWWLVVPGTDIALAVLLNLRASRGYFARPGHGS